MALKLHIFTIKKFPKLDSNLIRLAVISLESALKKYGNYYPELFLKECKYIDEKAVKYIHNHLSDFSYSSDESEEE